MYDFRPKVPVTITQTGESFDCPVGESVLKGMLRLGRKGIPVGCVNGGCGVCKVLIHEGDVTKLGPISRAHVTVEDEARGYTLACRVSPNCAVRLEIAGKMEKPFSKGHAAQARSSSTTP